MMNPRRLVLLVGLAALAVTLAHATDPLDFLSPQTGTQPVALMGGDTPSTYQVSCTSNTLASGATLLIAAVTTGSNTNALQAAGRPLRNRCFQNIGGMPVVIGSSTVASSDFWVLGASTTYSLNSIYCTHNSGAFYCAPTNSNAAQTVNVIQETQSQP